MIISITAFNIETNDTSIMIVIKITFNIVTQMTQYNEGQHNDTQHINNQHNDNEAKHYSSKGGTT